ncbi:MAG: hypothetical protein HZA35_01470 [Parcubacteria group bacterium]|nr:hypothetical protein [Parcubacteria group bacterium]
MKKSQQGLIVSFCVIILLIVGGGVYYYSPSLTRRGLAEDGKNNVSNTIQKGLINPTVMTKFSDTPQKMTTENTSTKTELFDLIDKLSQSGMFYKEKIEGVFGITFPKDEKVLRYKGLRIYFDTTLPQGEPLWPKGRLDITLPENSDKSFLWAKTDIIAHYGKPKTENDQSIEYNIDGGIIIFYFNSYPNNEKTLHGITIGRWRE